MNKQLFAVALVAILLSALASPSVALNNPPYSASVSVSNTNTTTTFGFPAGHVCLYNTGANTAYFSWDAAATSTPGANVLILSAGNPPADYTFGASGGPSSVGLITASSTTTVLVYAFQNTGQQVTCPTSPSTTFPASPTFSGTVTVTTNIVDSAASASQLVVTDASKNLVSNGAITTNALPKSASSGATLAASSISDNGSNVIFGTEPEIGIAGSGSNAAGQNIVKGPGPGTGNAAGIKWEIDRNLMTASGSSAQAQAPGFVVCESKTLSNTTATLTTLATVGAASNSAGSLDVDLSVSCTDATNFDSDHVRCTVAYVNKAGAITIGTPSCSASVAANNSGSCTVVPTFTSGSSLINVNVTPAFTTIVPTTTTGMATVVSHGVGAVTCQ